MLRTATPMLLAALLLAVIRSAAAWVLYGAWAPPAPAPETIILEITITDEVTGEPVVATVRLGDQVVGTADRLTVEAPLDAEQEGYSEH